MVHNGKATLDINHREYTITKNQLVLLSFGHFFKILSLSRDFRCGVLYVNREHADQIFSADMLYKRGKYSVKTYKNPILRLSDSDFSLLNKRIDFTEEIRLNHSHLYRNEMILNALRIFFLDLSNIIEKKEVDTDFKPSMEEIHFQKFLELVSKNYKKMHQVDFYADTLNITPHYLTLIVKKLSGQTVSDFIFQLLFSEAKILLAQANISIQQIAQELNFSDQSAFGKFFKRKSGLSPKAYRLEII